MTKHVHKYRRFTTTKGKDFWRCMIPGCTHALYQKGLLIGRDHVCWLCEVPMTIDEVSAEQLKPVCKDCKEERKELKERMSQISER